MSQFPPARDIARIVLVVLFIGLMIVSSLWILQPFLGALVWATMIVVATWPLMLKVEDALGGRRWAAVTVMTLVIGVPELVMNALAPSMTQSPVASSRRARVRVAPASLPASGSVSPKAPSARPAQRSGSQRWRCSSEPNV